MADYQVSAQTRTLVGKKVGQLRRKGIVPGTLYGPKLTSKTVQFSYRELELMLQKAGGTHIIDVNVEGDKTYPSLAREVQRDIIRGVITHVDFFVLDMDSVVRATIRVNAINESPIVTARKGIIISGTNTLIIEVLAANLISEVVVDLATLKEIGNSILVSDLDLGPNVRILNDPSEMIVKVVQPSAARSAEAAAE